MAEPKTASGLLAEIHDKPKGPPPATSIDFTKDVPIGWVSNPALMMSSGTSAFTTDTHVSLGYSGSGKLKHMVREPGTGIVRMLVEMAAGKDHWFLVWPSGQIAEVLDEGWKKP